MKGVKSAYRCPLSAEEQARAVELWRAGGTLNRVALLLGRSEEAVRAVLEKAGRVRRKHRMKTETWMHAAPNPDPVIEDRIRTYQKWVEQGKPLPLFGVGVPPPPTTTKEAESA